MIIIGSRAMKLERVTQKTDYDVMMTLEEFYKWVEEYEKYIVLMVPRSETKYKVLVEKDGLKVQYEVELGIDGTSTKLLLDNQENISIGYVSGFFGEQFHKPTKAWHMTTKRSHLIYPINFEKHIEDYHILKRSIDGKFIYGCEDKELLEKYYKLRCEEAAERYKQRTPKLNVATEDFFSSKLPVPNYFVHDHIHESMTHHDRPIFTMMQKDSSKAWCEKDMFFELSYEYQVQCVQEEAYVIALERYIIPQYGDNCNDFFDCYKRAVKRICTTLTSGWFREFAIENYPQVIENYNPEFVNKFIHDVISKKVRPQDGFKVSDIPLMKQWFDLL